MQKILSFWNGGMWRLVIMWTVSIWIVTFATACSSGVELSQSVPTSTNNPLATVSSVNAEIGVEVTSAFTSTSVNSPTPLATERPFTKTPLSTPTPTSTPPPLAVETVLPPVLPIESSEKYMLIGIDRLWHPDLARASESLEDMSFSKQPWSPDGRQLAAILRTRDSDSGVVVKEELALLDLNTEELIPLENTTFASSRFLSSSAIPFFPIWSPGGRYLLYAFSIEGDQASYQMVLYDLVTRQETLLSSPVRLHSLAGWSFDSQQIAYLRWSLPEEGEGKTVLEIMDIPTQTVHQMRQPADISIALAHWSPIDHHLALYIGGVDEESTLTTYGYDEIYLLDTKNEIFEQLKAPSTREDEYYGNPPNQGYIVHNTPWSPDGQSIIYSDRGLLCSLVIASRQETCFTEVDEQLSQLDAVGGVYPTWSPNGEWIGFVMKLDSVHCSPVAVIRPDGSDLRFTDVEAGDCSLFGPIWSPAK
ncbi:MAG: hypothetical protein KJ069_17525 [Anaerolineae bacterium]|nr:hypothetical protein [Anaerolineae bacterium]